MSKQINRNLTNLTPGERMWLARVFDQGVSQDVMAVRAKISHNRYVDAELGRCEPIPLFKGMFDGQIPPLQQRLRLARRRSGRQLWSLAAAVGVSHVTLLKMERRADSRLVAFWKTQGFRF